MNPNSWPVLPLEEWKDTYATLHRWTQIVGKIRLALTPHRNHWWNSTLYVTPRGLTTSSMPYNDKLLQIDLISLITCFLFKQVMDLLRKSSLNLTQ